MLGDQLGDEPNLYMGVSKNRGTPKSSILIGFFIINHPFWGTIIFGNTHIGNGWKSPFPSIYKWLFGVQIIDNNCHFF